MDLNINPLVVAQSLFKYIQDSSLATDFKIGRPEKFDPNSSDTKAWLYVFIPNFDQKPNERPAQTNMVWRGNVVVDCYSREQDGALKHLQKSADVCAVLCHESIAVKGYQTTGDPTIGLMRLHEARTTDRGKVGAWQMARLSMKMTVERTAV